jgi:hypothetical protein
MFDYRITVAAPPSHGEPLAYSMAPRTVPTLVSRFTNPRPPAQNWTTPIRAEDLGLISKEQLAEAPMRFGRHVTIAVPRTGRSDYQPALA